MQVIVLGMHRSGTSLLTHLLTLMGCHAGTPDELIGPRPDNLKGFWERTDVRDLNDRVLRSMQADWRRIARLDLGQLDTDDHIAFKHDSRKVLRKLEHRRPWVLKDPRLCLLFPLWRDLLKRPLCVLIYRSPVEVARSLEQRDGLIVPHSLALWEAYNLSMLRHSLELPRTLVSYHGLLRHPLATITRLQEEIASLGGPKLRELSEKEVLSAVDPNLRHQTIGGTEEKDYLTPPQAALLEALASGSALELTEIPAISPGSRETLSGIEKLATQAQEREQTLGERSARAEDCQRALTRSENASSEMQTTCIILEENLADARRDLEGIQQTLADERCAHRSELEIREQVVAAKQKTLTEFASSVKAFEERVREQESDLAEHRKALEAARKLRLETEQTLFEEREYYMREIEIREQALTAKDLTLAEFARSMNAFKRRVQIHEMDLESHRHELARVQRELGEYDSTLQEERNRFELELRTRHEAFQVQGRELQVSQQVAVSYRSALDTLRADFEEACKERELTAGLLIQAWENLDELRSQKDREMDKLNQTLVGLKNETRRLGRELEVTFNQLQGVRSSPWFAFLRWAHILRWT